jgi:hypothetical protein
MDDEALTRRALAAYYKTDSRGEFRANIPSSTGSGVFIAGGKNYVRLANGGDNVLAIYRVKPDGRLKRLRRWPDELGAAQ